MDVRYTSTTEGIDWDALAYLLSRAGLGNRPPAVLESLFRQSQVTVFAYDDGQLVGAARALSDYTLWSVVFDVAVDPAFQGKGIGAALVKRILQLAGTPNAMLKSNPGKERFYEMLGFELMPLGMERRS